MGMYTSLPLHPTYTVLTHIFLLFILDCPWISCLSFVLPPFSDGVLATLVVHTYGLESGQLQAWQAFYDAVGVSGCSKCNSRTNPCGCSSKYIECTSDDRYLTKIWLYSCSLSGKSFFCIIAFFIWFSHCAIFFLIVQYCQNDFCQFFFSYVGWLVPFFIFVIF